MEEQIPSFNDLADNASFIRWAKQSDPKDVAYWEQKLKDNPDSKDDAMAVRKIITHFNGEITKVDNEYLDLVWNKINAATLENNKVIPFRKRIMLVASAAAILIFLIFGFLPQINTYQAKNGEILSIVLPDYSKVTLNAGSSMSYKSNWFQTSRNINLDGEAFFNVKKGSSFKVFTQNGTITVLGTSFNIKNRNQKLFVNCYSGKVKVNDDNETFYLTKNQKISKIEGEFSALIPFSSKEGLDWTNGLFEFENASLTEVLEEFSRQFNIQIEIPASEKNRKINTSFNNKNIESALLNILWPLNLKAEKKNDKYIVFKPNIE